MAAPCGRFAGSRRLPSSELRRKARPINGWRAERGHVGSTGPRRILGRATPALRLGRLGLAAALLTLLLAQPAAATSLLKSPTVASTSAALVIRGATNMGFCGGDDWEPEIAADHGGHVYVVLAHFPGDPARPWQ